MKRSRPGRWAVLALIVTAAAATAGCRQPASAAGGQADDAIPPGVSPYDAEMTDVARVLGGVLPTRPQAYAPLLASRAWREYESDARTNWSSAWAARLQPVRTWAETELKKADAGCRTLLHPFGGTRFLQAYLMFPSCEGYVLVGSEPVGQLPRLDGATVELARVANDVRRAFPDVFPAAAGPGRRAEPQSPGALRLLLVQLARLDARIISASRFDLASNGRPLEAIPVGSGNARPPALSITFEVPGGRPQSLVYLPADLDDAALRRAPAVWTFLRLQAPFTALLAPASAMGGENATLLRELVIAQSRAILQDRPALPPGLLAPRRWAVSTLDRPPAGALGAGAVPTLAIRKAPAQAPAKR